VPCRGQSHSKYLISALPSTTVERRSFLLTVAAGMAASLAACSADGADNAGPLDGLKSSTGNHPAVRGATPLSDTPTPTPTPSPTPTPTPTLPPPPPPSPTVRPPITPIARGPYQVISQLPGQGSNVALTIDDGLNADVVGAYLDFIESTGIRLTFFPNGVNQSWTIHKDRIGHLVDIGQIQIGNHTWSHQDLTKLSASGIADQLNRNDDFIQNTWGVTSRPYMRPPYGYRNATTDQICANLGYTKIIMWYGSFGDAALLTEDVLWGEAMKWLLAQRIVIGHANYPTVTHLYPQILEIIKTRNLQTVTLRDVLGN
jgi:peptidoglycan-N-acetylmuramic acid deacetylase